MDKAHAQLDTKTLTDEGRKVVRSTRSPRTLPICHAVLVSIWSEKCENAGKIDEKQAD